MFILVVTAFYLSYVALAANYASARLMAKLPKHIDQQFKIVAIMILVIQTTAVILVLSTESEALNALRHVANMIAVVFVVYVVEMSFYKLRNAINNMHKGLSDTELDSGRGSALQLTGSEFKLPALGQYGSSKIPLDEVNLSTQPRGAPNTTKPAMHSPRASALQIVVKSEGAKSINVAMNPSERKSDVQMPQRSSAMRLSGTRQRRSRTKIERNARRTAKRIRRKITWVLIIFPIVCSFGFAALAFLVIDGFVRNGNYKDDQRTYASGKYNRGLDFSMYVNLIVLMFYQYYAAVPPPKWMYRCLPCSFGEVETPNGNDRIASPRSPKMKVTS